MFNSFLHGCIRRGWGPILHGALLSMYGGNKEQTWILHRPERVRGSIAVIGAEVGFFFSWLFSFLFLKFNKFSQLCCSPGSSEAGRANFAAFLKRSVWAEEEIPISVSGGGGGCAQ